MSFDGHIENGRVVLDAPVPLPDGTPVRVEATNGTSALAENTVGNSSTLSERLSNFLRHSVDLPEDAALNHDHYLYGAPKK